MKNLSDDEFADWLKRHENNANWGFAFGVLGIILQAMALWFLFTDESITRSLIFLALGLISYGLFSWHQKQDSKLHEEIDDEKHL